MCFCHWWFGSTLCVFACCVFSRPRVSREHGGAWWGYCRHTKPSELLLPAYTGKPLQTADESFYFTGDHIKCFFCHHMRSLCLISGVIVCFSISTTLKSTMIWWFMANKQQKNGAFDLCRYITWHCVSVFKMEMVNPMKNKKCNHHYDEGAIRGLIKTRQSQKKKCR